MQKKITTFGEAEFAFHPIVAQASQSPQAIQRFAGSDAIAPCPNCGVFGVSLVQMPSPLELVSTPSQSVCPSRGFGKASVVVMPKDVAVSANLLGGAKC